MSDDSGLTVAMLEFIKESVEKNGGDMTIFKAFNKFGVLMVDDYVCLVRVTDVDLIA